VPSFANRSIPIEATELVVTPEEQSPDESEALHHTESRVRTYLQVLQGGQERRPSPPQLVFEDGGQIELPPRVLRVLQFALHHMARGDPFAIVSQTKMLTTNEAARILSVSRPFLVQLLGKGEIKFTKVGTHHRLTLRDVLEYKQRRDRQMLNALDQLACEAQEAGNYFDE